MISNSSHTSRWFREFGKALDPSVLTTSAYALVVGFIGGLVAQGLLELIYLFTNIFFYGKWSFTMTFPVHNHLGAWVILIPPLGGLAVGVMIHFWEPTLKGHGIPEAMEAVLIGKSKVRMRVGILKPLATAFAIGTGGPFGAEGPIIQTGAAFGSIFAQLTHLTPYQRRVLLASGAAAGMAATFVAPLAGILVAIELLLFEFRARSFIPVAISSVGRHCRGRALPRLGAAVPHACVLTGQHAGTLALRPDGNRHGADRHRHDPGAFLSGRGLRPLPAEARGHLGAGHRGLATGSDRVFLSRRSSGHGYDTIRDMLNDRLTTHALLGISAAKFAALVLSLGSGTTGGVFAPSLIVGGGVGAVYAQVWHHFLPHLVSDPALYALVAMAAVFGGIARAPFTSIIFLFELSRNPNALLPLVVCCMVSDGFVRLFSAESIMTGKLIKRGLIVRQDYTVPMLMRGRIEEVMRKNFTVIKADDDVQAVVREVSPEQAGVIPVIEPDGSLAGIVEAHDLLKGLDRNPKVREIMRQDYIAARVGETVDEVTRDMVIHDVENIVVVEGDGLLNPSGWPAPPTSCASDAG